MTNEEKQVFDDLKERIKKSRYVFYADYSELIFLINIIESQQKEIEELKQNRDEYKEEYIKLLNARYYNYISKDKIREKIKELEKAINQNKIMSIQVRQHGFAQKTIEQYVIRATVEILKELIEEDDGDHIPRID